jgi:hypothetical protein
MARVMRQHLSIYLSIHGTDTSSPAGGRGVVAAAEPSARPRSSPARPPAAAMAADTGSQGEGAR